MIIYKNKKAVEFQNGNCIGVTGENLAHTQEFLISDMRDTEIDYKIYLRFADGSVNSVIPDSVVIDSQGTLIVWQVKKTDIFMHGYFEVQLEGRNSDELIFQTEIITLYADESIAVEDKTFENPNAETLKIRDEASAMLKQCDQQLNKIEQNFEILEGYDINLKENASKKVSVAEEVFSATENYPSVQYLDNYYYSIDDSYSAEEADILLDNKADKATTLAGYGIDDAYNKAQTDTKLSLKINTNKIATEITEAMDNTKLPNVGALKTYLDNYYYGVDEAYSAEEIDTKLSLKINTNKIATAITESMDNTKLPNAGAIKAYLDNYYYGIDDLYDMEQVDIFLNQKADVKGNANILKIPDFTETKNGVTLTASKNHITINGKTTANSTFRIILASPYLPINGTYTFSAQNAENSAHGSVTLYSGSSGSTNITSAIAFENNSSTTFTADNTVRQIGIWLPQNTNFVNQQFDLQLESGEIKTEFNSPTTLNEDLQSGSISQRHLDNTLRNKIFGDERILSKLISDAGFAGLIKSYCCIGDSLTEGFFDISNGAERDFEPSDFCSYPQQLKRITGASVLNYGISGSTAKPSDNSRSWLKQANAKGWLTSEDKSVGYIIALGVNDLILYSEFSGDVTTDINLTDYTQNAQTSVGGYAAIIQKIKGLQSDAKIFCVTLPNDRGDSEIRTATNEKIKAIANLLGCYVIDLQNEWFSEEEREDFCAKYRNGGHWNAMGYNQLAKAYVTYIDHIISNNIDDFRNIQFVGTEMQFTM